MLIKIKMRNQNTQEGNTWFSGDPEDETQIHMPRDMWVALGKPDDIMVTISNNVPEDV